MKRIILAIAILSLIVPFVSEAQEYEISREHTGVTNRLSFGINAGVGQNYNGYRLNPDDYGFNYFEGDMHFTGGINVSYFVTDWLRPRFEFRYSEIKYGLNWSKEFADFDKTITKLYHLNYNLNFDILLIDRPYFQFFVSPGLVSEFIVDELSRTYLADGTNNVNNYYVVTQQYSEETAGANLSLIAKYKITEDLGLTVTPGYNFYFKNYLPSNDLNYSRLLFNVGFEYSLPF